MAGVSIRNLTRHTSSVTGLSFRKVAKEVLPGWNISLVFVGPKKAQALNEKLRGKAYVPNVLSYSLGGKNAEIIICPAEAKKQAGAYAMSGQTFVLYLFIHGALHIKGWAHGARMERCERNLLAKFLSAPAGALHAGGRTGAHETTHRHRHRYRDVPGKNGRRRGTFR